jgi:hypothetical protein
MAIDSAAAQQTCCEEGARKDRKLSHIPANYAGWPPPVNLNWSTSTKDR